jgi:hypothetical protein
MPPRPWPVLAGLALATASPAVGQRPEVRTSLQVFLGASLSQQLLWAVARQPIHVPNTFTPALFDTVALRRTFTQGPTIGLTVVHFPFPRLGVSAAIGYVGMNPTTECDGVYFNGGSQANRDLCANIPALGRSLNIVVIDLQGLVRPLPRGIFSPYLRGGVGLATYTGSTLYVEGQDSSGTRVLIDDPNPESISTVLTWGGGITAALGRQLQFHVDLGSTDLRFPAITGPADRLARAPSARHRTSHTVLTFGLDFVIDAKAGRRY